MWEETDTELITIRSQQTIQRKLNTFWHYFNCISFELVLSDISWPKDLVVVVLFLATEGRGQREGLSHVTRDSGTISM